MSVANFEDADPPCNGELMKQLMDVIEHMTQCSDKSRATVLLAGSSVLLRDIAQLPKDDARTTLKTVRDLADEYLRRSR